MNINKSTPDVIEQLTEKTKNIRKNIIRLNANSPAGGHTGADLSQVEILTSLYFHVMNISPQNMADPDRDIYIQSKGHAAGGYYCVLAEAGFIPKDWLPSYQHSNSNLPGHPVRQKTPGVELNTGALGHGMPVAVGIALAAKLSNSSKRIFSLCGDGELGEGSIYESAMCAAKFKLDNLTVIIDRNKLQLAGETQEIMPTEPIADKWRAFNWHVSECKGNDLEDVITTLQKNTPDKPHLIIAHTKKGAGISFIEGKPEWHHRVPKGKEIEQALAELGE